MCDEFFASFFVLFLLIGFANFNSGRAQRLRSPHVQFYIVCILCVAITTDLQIHLSFIYVILFHFILFPNFLFASLCPYIIFIVRTAPYICGENCARQGTARLPIDKFIYTL